MKEFNKKLRPCPFCGQPASIKLCFDEFGFGTYYVACCGGDVKMGCISEKGYYVGDFVTPEDAVKAWNKE